MESSIGAPEGGIKQTLTSPSSSPRATKLIPGMVSSEAPWTSAIKSFRPMAVEWARLRLAVRLSRRQGVCTTDVGTVERKCRSSKGCCRKL
jgi:hypothetical protein